MGTSESRAADLARLTDAAEQPGIALERHVRDLIAAAKHAVASYQGMTLTIGAPSAETSVSVHDHGSTPITTSLRIPLSAPSILEPGSTLTLYASTPGAFVDLAADLSHALGVHYNDLVLDTDLTPTHPSGVTGLDRRRDIDQAIGVLIGQGHTPESAAQELDRLADLASSDFHTAAHALLRSLTRRPHHDD